MKINGKYDSYGLYFLRPSQIIDSNQNFLIVKSKSGFFPSTISHWEIIEQNVTFRTIPNQIVIAERSIYNKNLYTPLAEKILPCEHYYNQTILWERDLFCCLEQDCLEQAGFIGLFPNDAISLLDLLDFVFIQNLGKIGFTERLKYFDYKNNLKSKYHQELSKFRYTKEELEELKQYLVENVFSKEEKTQTITKNYTVVREGLLHMREKDLYKGYTKPIDKQFKKILKSNGKEIRF